MEELVQKLASIDELETWKKHCQGHSNQDKKAAFERAQSLWIVRKVSENTLYLHPDVISDLKKQNWLPNDLQKRMIWASVLASAEGSDSRQRFKSIKADLLKKYGRDWWEDVYRRQKSAFAAKERIRKQTASNGSSVNMLMAKTHLFAEIARDQIHAALSMIPKL
ncbi:hypothetical protein [Plesiomonas shigelloides]|uniref:hypothetical protein n=1 Tax=Plesiomonas shigelloides TaxID=703 RepID=UPI000A1169A4|nr:hypothetical protein [Plesiomonas shigelloides]